MSTTLELPEHLVRELQLRAAREGRGVAEVVGDLLAGRASVTCEPADKKSASADAAPRIITDSITGLPVIVCTRTPPPGEEMTPERIATILHQQEVEWLNAAR